MRTSKTPSLRVMQTIFLLFLCFAKPAWALKNVFLILTDDQRFDTLWAMPVVQSRLVANGVQFTNAYVSTPQCCPARSGFLSGGFLAQNTGVLAVNQPNGGWENFNHDDNLANQLAPAGYSSAMVGKYFARFNNEVRPTGWTMFHAQDTKDTPALKAKALEFLDQHNTANPFLLYLSTGAPHIPPKPAVQDQGLFSSYLYRGRGYSESNLSDKPGFVANSHSLWDKSYFSSQAEEDEFHRDQLRSLQGVDRAIDEILNKIDVMGQLANTVIIFTSDNGLLWGEHGQFGKNNPYEESIRVPLVVVVPGVVPRIEDNLVAVNTDISPTLHALAGASYPTDGLSLLPLLNDTNASWRTHILIEQFRSGQWNSAWSSLPWVGLIQKNATEYVKYFEYAGGAKQLYDLANDPFELESKHNDPAFAAKRAELLGLINQQRGLAITSGRWPPIEPFVDEPFTYHLSAWGGDGNYTWSIDSGALPAGVSLNTVTGEINGTPAQAGIYTVVVALTDTKLANHTGSPQSVVQEYIFDVVDLDADNDGLSDVIEAQIGTDPYLLDTDGDGLSDFDEVNVDGVPSSYQGGVDTDPNNYDTDGDSLADGIEVANGSNPLDPDSYPALTDGDLAPWGNPNGVIDAGDILIAFRIGLGLLTPRSLEFAHGDMNSDAVINLSDIIVITKDALN